MNVSKNVLGRSRTLSLVAAIIAVCVAPAVAQTQAGTTQMLPAGRAFIINMLQISRGQVAMATLAQQRTNDPDAAVAAAQTAAEWCALRAHLASLAATAGAPAPVALSTAQQAQIAQLQLAPRSQVMAMSVKFERAGNQMALEQMRAEGSTGNAQISQFIAYARPEISGYDHVLAAENSSGRIRAGAFSWTGPPRTAYTFNGRTRSGAFSWTGPTRFAYDWTGPIRAGAFSWK